MIRILNNALILLLIFSVNLTAQNGAENNNFAKAVSFLPTTPNAAAIEKAGFFNLNKNTGAPNINIPLISAKGNQLSIDVSLTYATNGIKVDEIASRVGMGWSLNAGGVVTRTVRGFPDEGHTRLAPWHIIGNNLQTLKFCNLLTEMSSDQQGYDAEPDLFHFNFNGISGSFVLDADGNAVQIPAGNLKIETQLGGQVPWNIRITTPDGVRYSFGGGFSAVEKTKQLSSCSRNYDDPIAVAWYLDEIQHPTGEKITLQYIPITYINDVSVNESITQLGFPLFGDDCHPEDILNDPASPNDAPVRCVIRQETIGKLLRSISLPGYGNITFEYMNRPDCNDQLVQNIIFRSSNNENRIVKNIGFNYSFEGYKPEFSNEFSVNKITPYLSAISDLQSGLSHRFGYINPGSRPSRLTYAQDHWGFFNGKMNSTMIPPLSDDDYLDHIRPLPHANADRSPNFNYAVMGMLNKIVYPTGGIQYIIYEPNYVAVRDSLFGALHEYECSVNGVGINFYNEISKSFEFSIDSKQDVKIEANAICPSCTSENSSHYNGSIEIKKIDGSIVRAREHFIGERKIDLRDLLPGRYVVLITAKTQENSTRAKVFYKPVLSNGGSYKNLMVGGVRVKEILTGNKNEKPLIKKYNYTEIGSLNISSSKFYSAPKYGKSFKNRKTIERAVGVFGLLTDYLFCYRKCYGLYANSLSNLYKHSGSIVSYSSVLESEGNNFENGIIETKYLVGKDEPTLNLWNDILLNTPQSNYSIFQNAKVQEINVYKSTRLGLKAVKSIINQYSIDERASRSVVGFSVSVNFPNPAFIIDTTNPNAVMKPSVQDLADAYSINHYVVLAPWSYLSKTEEKVFDDDGQNPVVTVTEYHYDNPLHKQLTRKIVDNSDISLTKTEFKYPQDFPDDQVCREMRDVHQIAPVIQTRISRKSDEMHDYYPVSEVYNVYREWIGNIGSYYDIGEVKSSFKGESLQSEGIIYQRDERGNIIDYETKDKVRNAVLWGFNGQYPIAKITGTDYATLSQEAQGYTYQSMYGEELNGFLRELRNRLLSTSHLTTFNYIPFVGVTFQSDPNGIETSFSYDEAGRLVSVFDDKQNLVKKIEYNYAGSEIGNQFGIYFNDEITMNVMCSECTNGTVGHPAPYIIPAGVYYSDISANEATAKAKENEKDKAQEWADQNAKCTNNDLWCIGERLKKVGCNCEVAQKICLGPDPDYPGPDYKILYQYRWSDETFTPAPPQYLSYNPCAPQNQ